MRRRAAAGSGVVAALTALATAAGGCSVSLVDQTSRAGGFNGATYVSRAHVVSPDEVPVRGHLVRVIQAGGGEVVGELIAADEEEMVVAPAQGSWVRIPIGRVRAIAVGLASPQAGVMMIASLSAMLIGFAGLASNPDRSSLGAFLGGWGVVWLPLGLFVALPSALVLLATGDGTLSSAAVGVGPLVHDLYEFARFPQGEPGRKRTSLPSIAPPQAPAGARPAARTAPWPAAPPAPAAAPPGPSIQTVPLVAPPDAAPPSGPEKPKAGPARPPPEEQEDDSEPAVVPYSPDQPPPPPKR